MKKIVVVDDDKDLLVAMKEYLRKAGYDVVITTSCEEGLTILSTFKPDLFFLDIHLDGEDGREMCKKIKSRAEHKHIFIILMSADDAALKTYKEYDADFFLRKPLQPSQLLNLAAMHLMAG